MKTKTGTISTNTSATLFWMRAGQTAKLVLSVANGQSFIGTAVVEGSADGGQTWSKVASYIGTSGTPLANTVATLTLTPVLDGLYRVRVENIDQASNALVYNAGLNAFRQGEASIDQLPGRYEELRSGGTAVAVDLGVYETRITTGATQGNESVTVGDGTGCIPGQRKLIKLSTRSHASDVVVLDHANIVNSAGAALSAATLGAAGHFVLLSWNGAKWQVIYSSGATLTAA